MSDGCKAEIRRGDTWHPRYEACGKAAGASGFCKVHDPEIRRAKQAARDAERLAQMYRQWHARALHWIGVAPPEKLDELRAALNEAERASSKAAGANQTNKGN